MRKNIPAVTVAVLLAGATVAQAAEITGTVRTVNTTGDAITLDNGTTYTLPENIEAESLKPGEKVKMTYSSSKGHNKASSLTRMH